MVDGQFAEKGLGARYSCAVVTLIGLQKTIHFELDFADLVLIALIEDRVQKFLGFSLGAEVSGPNIPCSHFEGFFILLGRWNYHQFFEGVVEVFLVVVERRVLRFPYFPPPFRCFQSLKFTIFSILLFAKSFGLSELF